MATWHSRGLRGSTFEDLINRTNDIYENSNLCLIQKVPTPITPINIDKDTRHITLAYFDKKSTVDYIGVVQGIPVCFDAKECHSDLFPLQNIHEHQINFMQTFEKQQGMAFFLLYFTQRDEFYYLRLEEVARVSATKNWIPISSFMQSPASLFLIWIFCRKIYLCGMLDSCSIFSYNMNSLVIYHCTTIKFKGAIHYAK